MQNRPCVLNIKILIFLIYSFIILDSTLHICIIMFITSRAFERYAALYILLEKQSIYELFSFLLDFIHWLQRVNIFVRKKINHREAASFTKTNVTNARMVGGERIDRFWWNLRYRAFLVYSFIYIWTLWSEKQWDPFPFYWSWGLFW